MLGRERRSARIAVVVCGPCARAWQVGVEQKAQAAVRWSSGMSKGLGGSVVLGVRADSKKLVERGAWPLTDAGELLELGHARDEARPGELRRRCEVGVEAASALGASGGCLREGRPGSGAWGRAGRARGHRRGAIGAGQASLCARLLPAGGQLSQAGEERRSWRLGRACCRWWRPGVVGLVRAAVGAGGVRANGARGGRRLGGSMGRATAGRAAWWLARRGRKLVVEWGQGRWLLVVVEVTRSGRTRKNNTNCSSRKQAKNCSDSR
jgi:hypothetical protein